MQHFYTLSPEQQAEHLLALAKKALHCWDITDAEIKLIKHRENAVFSVLDTHSGQRFALRVHRHNYHSDTELNSELQWMQALTDAGVTTPPVIPTSDHQLFTLVSCAPVPETRQCDLLGWVDGIPLGSIEDEGDISSDPAHLVENYRTVGQLAGLIHNQSSAWSLPEGFARDAWDEDGLIGENPLWGRFWELETLTETQRELLLRAASKVRSQLQAFGKDADRYSLIHADFLPENLLKTADGIRIIDFDDSGFGWHLFEFATSLFFHLGEPHFETIRDAMIQGYREVRQLPDSHLEMLPTFFLARGLVYLGWVHTRKETEIAQAITNELIAGVTTMAADYLGQ